MYDLLPKSQCVTRLKSCQWGMDKGQLRSMIPLPPFYLRPQPLLHRLQDVDKKINK